MVRVCAWLLFSVLLDRLNARATAAECDTTGDDLIVDVGTECSLPATVGKTFRRVLVEGRLLIDKDSVGRYATLRAEREVVVAYVGVLTTSGRGFGRGQGPGHGVTHATAGSGGKSLPGATPCNNNVQRQQHTTHAFGSI
ncbi:hypothetical protein NP493_311g00036 [Ridgeia piscesae]|uniref:Secreted protein n=1 Tax=Ridgeia piscesae TaxID=27915 RepID=A0AAD9L4Q3_RIDPI|nr:hypothetical protein NP493_311g00036 [Ridgeia piscesae]